MCMSLKTSNQIAEGDLVTLDSRWAARVKPGVATKNLMGIPNTGDFLGIVTNIRLGAGMYENNHYATVLWENNRHVEHYLKDLVKIK